MILEAVISTELSSQAVWCWSPVVWLRRVWRHVGDVVTCPALWMQHRGSAEIASQLQPWPVVSLSMPRPGWVLRLSAGVLFITVCLPWPECNASAPKEARSSPRHQCSSHPSCVRNHTLTQVVEMIPSTWWPHLQKYFWEWHWLIKICTIVYAKAVVNLL